MIIVTFAADAGCCELESWDKKTSLGRSRLSVCWTQILKFTILVLSLNRICG